MNTPADYTIEQIGNILNGKITNKLLNNKKIKHLLSDSRQIIYPATTIFFAIRTKKNDGHLYINELIIQGVKCFVVSEEPSYATTMKDICFIVVDNPLEGLQKLSAFHRQQFNLPLIGITGSNGKTIIKEWLAQLLSSDYNVIKNPKSYNSQIGVPLSVWQINKNHNIGIFEAGISKPGEMENLQEILMPNIGIFANIGPAHDEGFKNKQEKIREKLKLYTQVETLIFCADHKELATEIYDWSKKFPGVNLFPWSRNGRQGMLQMDVIKEDEHNCSLKVKNSGKSFFVDLPFTDKASIENSMHCIALLLFLNYDSTSIKKHIPLLQSIAMRMELKHGINNSTLINDSYNSDVYSLKVALEFLATQKQHKNKILVLSDILQTGVSNTNLYKQVAGLLKEKKINGLIGIGKDISLQSDLFDVDKYFYKNTNDFLNHHNFEYFRNSSVLIKGARVFEFEKIMKSLQLKDHQTVLEINLDAMVHNLNVFKSLIKPGVKTMAMIKAFGYGIGSNDIANVLQFHNVDYLAVAYTDEGKELRNAGITIPVMVMNPEFQNFHTLTSYKLEPVVYSSNILKNILDGITQSTLINIKNPLNIHIKIDTGMNRLGFLPDDIHRLCDTLNMNPSVRVKSVYSHFAASDDPQFDSFSKDQFETYTHCVNIIEDRIKYKFIKHICNTAAISRFGYAQLDMVRLGLGLYGISSDPETQKLLKNISTFKSVISQVKTVNKGAIIGYNPRNRTKSIKKIGIVPVGYADGLNRNLGNGASSLSVNKQKAPIIGNICMDMCMIDISKIKANEGDEVIIFDENNPITKISNDLDTIPYEILTNVSARVKRVYYQD